MFFSAYRPLHWLVLPLWLTVHCVEAAPKVVASIAPIHSLVAAVMKDAGEPVLLMRANVSPHTYQLRPSDARQLEQADLIVWIGPELETVLESPLSKIAQRAKKVSLMENPNLTILPARKGGAWNDDERHHHQHEKANDPHVWLSPDNAKAMVSQISAELISQDRNNAHVYRRNSASVLARLDSLATAGKQTLSLVRGVPYLVFHDAFQYFEEYFELSAVGAITTSPSRAPSAYRVKQLREIILREQVRCVFLEPQFSDAVVDVILEDTAAQRGQLDPLGVQVEPGPEAYFDMMTYNIGVFSECLAPR